MPLTDDGQLESIPLSKDARERLVKQVREHWEDGMTHRGDFPTRHDEHYRRFLGDYTLRPQGPWPNAPRLFTGDTRSTMETIMAELWKAVFPGFEAVDIDPFDDAALRNKDQAPRMARYALRWLINDAEQGGWAHIGKMCLFDALCDATGFLKVYPWRPPWRNANPDTIIRIDNIDEGTLLLPPGATGTQYPDARYVGQELWVPWDDLVRKKRQGFTVPSKDDLKPDTQTLTERERTEQEREGRQADPAKDGYCVGELYERFVLDKPDEGEEDDLVVSFYPHAKDEHCLARVLYLTDLFPNQARPLRPFFTLSVWPQPRQLRGMSLPERLRSYQDMQNRLAEQMVNYGDVSILPFFFYNALVTGDIPDLRQVMPGQGVPVNDLGGIQAVPRASLNRHFLEQMQYWKSQIEGDAHVSDIAQGRSPTRPNAPRTLGGTQLLLQQGREAFSDLVPHLGYQYTAVLDFWWRLWQHFVPPGLLVPMRQAGQQAPAPPPGQMASFNNFMNPFENMSSMQEATPYG